MFLSRNLPEKANILVLRTSHFQGATIRPIVPIHKHSLLFTSSKIKSNYFQLFTMKAAKANVKFEKQNKQKSS